MLALRMPLPSEVVTLLHMSSEYLLSAFVRVIS